MRKHIAILGSTGSIGKKTLNIIKKNKNKFIVDLITTNKNIRVLQSQIKIFKVKNVIVRDFKKFQTLKIKLKKYKRIKIYNNYECFKKIFQKKKIDYVMSSITGLSGLEPTIKIIKYTNRIAIANKETIICAWNLVQKLLIKNKTKFIPIDSEHFSIWSLLNGFNSKKIEKIYITASGGPFLNISKNKFNNIKPINALKHPNWSMGKKISIDSSTLMNKVFEVIEAQKIFNIDIKKFKILIHPKSYLHSIIKFKNGTTKLLIHDTDMKIPIFNSIYYPDNTILKTNNLNFKILNNLNLQSPNKNKFPSLNILNKVSNKISLFETVLVSANDELVDHFLRNKISYLKMNIFLNKILNFSEFRKLKNKKPKNIKQIIDLNKYVRLKTADLCIK